MYKILFAMLVAAFLASAGCKTVGESITPHGKGNAAKALPHVDFSPEKLNKRVTILATQIFSNMKEFNLENRSVVVTTFVDMDSLNTTSQFGRFVSERLVYVLHKMDFRVFEIRQSKYIKVIKHKGEFHLTREGKELLNRYRSDAVIVGTYLLVNGELTLHARMLDRGTSRIVSVASVAFKLSEDPYLSTLLIREHKHVEVKTDLVAVED